MKTWDKIVRLFVLVLHCEYGKFPPANLGCSNKEILLYLEDAGCSLLSLCRMRITHHSYSKQPDSNLTILWVCWALRVICETNGFYISDTSSVTCMAVLSGFNVLEIPNTFISFAFTSYADQLYSSLQKHSTILHTLTIIWFNFFR